MWKCHAKLVRPQPRVQVHSGQVLNIFIYLSWDKLMQFCISFFIKYYELTMHYCMENRVDPDQLTSSEAS